MLGRSALLLLLLNGAAADPRWLPAPTHYKHVCALMTEVFNVKICLAESAADLAHRNKANHVAHVLAQVIDFDEDSLVDDIRVHQKMVDDNSIVYVPLRCYGEEVDKYNDIAKPAGRWQMLCAEKVHLTACDIPFNRGVAGVKTVVGGEGADKNDFKYDDKRAEWPAKVDAAGCSKDYDATFEHVHHLVTEAAARVYPTVWGLNFNSSAGKELAIANGNCGWAFNGSYVDPSSKECKGYFATKDAGCRLCDGCVVKKGITYAVMAYIGGLYTNHRFSKTKGEWMASTPDASMTPTPPSRVFETTSPALYKLVSDFTSEGHLWLPRGMPTGGYTGTRNGGSGTVAWGLRIDEALPMPHTVDDEAPCNAAPPAADDDLTSGEVVAVVFGVILFFLLIAAFCLFRGSGRHASSEPL